MIVQRVEEGACGEADKESDGDVAQVVDAEVEACEGGGGTPEVENGGHAWAAEEPCKEGGYAEGVAGMAGEESKTASTIVQDGVDEIHDFGVAGGTPARHGGLTPAGAEPVGDKYHQTDAQQDAQTFFPRIVLKDHVEEHDDEQRPCKGIGHGNHQIIEK